MNDLNPKMHSQKLLETVADISFIAGERKFFSGNSREDISNFILWAHEFQKQNAKVNWNEVDYRLDIENFAMEKIQNFSSDFQR